MNVHTIDTAAARQMALANAIQGAEIIGEPGGWSVLLRTGTTCKPLGTQRADQPRTWASLDTCVQYLREELDIVRIELDASGHGAVARPAHKRPDTSARMKRAHRSAAYDAWFERQVQEALDETGPGIPHEQVKAKFAAKRKALNDRLAHE